MSLILDSFIFENYALPQRVAQGGEHHLVIHKLPGGARVIDAMGRDDCDINWEGRFQGPLAVQMSQAIDQLRISAKVVPLVVDSQSYQVVVHRFEWDYERFYQILYRITCVVLSSSPSNSTVSLDQLVIGDMGLALQGVQSIGN